MFESSPFSDPTAAPVQRPSAAAGRPDPVRARALLRAGNWRFAQGSSRSGRRPAARIAATGDQRPYAAVVGCLDARVPVEALFDQDTGAVCVIRSAGHVLDRAVLASVEFAVTDFEVPLLVVLGHDDCRAIATAIDAVRSGKRVGGARGYLVDEITPAVVDAGPDLDAVTRRHVQRTVDRLTRTDAVAEAVGRRRLDVVGAVYRLDTGYVDVLQP